MFRVLEFALSHRAPNFRPNSGPQVRLMKPLGLGHVLEADDLVSP